MTKLIVAFAKFTNATKNIYGNYEIMSGVPYTRSRCIIHKKYKVMKENLKYMQHFKLPPN